MINESENTSIPKFNFWLEYKDCPNCDPAGKGSKLMLMRVVGPVQPRSCEKCNRSLLERLLPDTRTKDIPS